MTRYLYWWLEKIGVWRDLGNISRSLKASKTQEMKTSFMALNQYPQSDQFNSGGTVAQWVIRSVNRSPERIGAGLRHLVIQFSRPQSVFQPGTALTHMYKLTSQVGRHVLCRARMCPRPKGCVMRNWRSHLSSLTVLKYLSHQGRKSKSSVMW